MAECLDHNIRSLHYSLLRLWVCSSLGRYWIRCAIVSAMLSTCLCLSSRFSLDVYCDASTWFYTTVYIYLFIILHLKATTFHPYYVNHFIVIDFVLVGKAIQIWLFIPLNIVEWDLMMTIYQTLGHFVETLNIRIFCLFRERIILMWSHSKSASRDPLFLSTMRFGRWYAQSKSINLLLREKKKKTFSARPLVPFVATEHRTGDYTNVHSNQK